MRWPARFRTDERGFTLVELMVGMVIITLLIGAIGSALVVSLNTTNATNQRMSENHDVQITSSYLANDVQSAAGVTVGSGGNCSGAFTTLATFTYWAPGNPPTPNGPPAVYKCGTVGGERRSPARSTGPRSSWRTSLEQQGPTSQWLTTRRSPLSRCRSR